jgi:hypothetical protein
MRTAFSRASRKPPVFHPDGMAETGGQTTVCWRKVHPMADDNHFQN